MARLNWNRRKVAWGLVSAGTFLAVLAVVTVWRREAVLAHCDTLDGPVVKAAREALAKGDVNRVLIWIPQKDEAEIKRAFDQALAVRKLSPGAREMADGYFFETLVRIHRAGEGEPYTGLKAAGEEDLGPAIKAADKAVEDGAIEPVVKLLAGAVENAVRERFKELQARKNFKPDDVAAGREYVTAYVTFVHLVEGIHDAAAKAGHEHHGAAEEPPAHAHEH